MPKKRLTRKKLHEKIVKLVEKHGSVRVDLKYRTEDPNVFSFRRRKIYKDGKCVVAYKSEGYEKFSNYTCSCFADGCLSVKQTVKNMYSHDTGEWRIIEIRYGKGLKKTIKP